MTAPTPDPTAVPWIWATMTGGPILYDPATKSVFSVLCPSWACVSAGTLVDLDMTGRIIPHASPFDPQCVWTGVRVVPEPGLLEQLEQDAIAKRDAGEGKSGRNK